MGAELVVVTLGGMAMCFGAAGICGVWNYWKRRPRDPREILAERFAQGEIDVDEYQRRLSVLIYGPPLPLDLSEPVPQQHLTAGTEAQGRLEAGPR